MLPAGLTSRLTPKHRRLAAWLGAAALLYSLFGFFAVPAIVGKVLKSTVADTLKLEADASRIEFNPWTLALKLDGFVIREPGADTLVSARSLYVNLDLLPSLWIRGAWLAELDLLEPYVNVALDPAGELNLMKLVPPSDNEDSGDAHWRIGKLGIRQGHVDFRDATRATPFSTSFKPLNIALENLSSQPDKDGGYTLAAETGEGEKLSWHGTVALKPLRSQGRLEIRDLKAHTLWRYAQDQLPVIVDSGRIAIAGNYTLLADEQMSFTLEQGHFRLQDLHMTQTGKHPLLFALDDLKLDGMHLDWPLKTAGATGLELSGFRLLGNDSKGTLPLFGFGTLGLHDISWQAATETGGIRSISLNDTVLRNEEQQELLALPSLLLETLQARPATRELALGNIRLENGTALLQLHNGDKINWLDAIDSLSKRFARMQAPADTTATPSKKAEAPWKFALGELDLSHFTIQAEDLRFDPAVKVPLQDITMRIHPRLQDNAPHHVEGGFLLGTGGKVGLNGTLSETPLKVDTTLAIAGLNLPPLAAYFSDIGRFELESGKLDVNGRLAFEQAAKTRASFNGRVAVNRFAANDLVLNERFMAWEQLAADGVQWQLDPMRVSVKEVRAERPFARLIIAPDYTLNLQHVFATADSNTTTGNTKPAGNKAADTDMVPASIERLLVQNGSMLFADLTLKPQFATGIQNLSGNIQGISTRKDVRASIDLKGTVDQSGKALISGSVSPLASDTYSDLRVRFDNIELTTMTPYSAKFAGYRIDKGKLSLDLNYNIRDRQLKAENKVVLNQLTLGDKVESPDAMNLPLRLAVAILKDSNGIIDLDLPVSGSLDDPKFKVGPLIWKALVNVLTKVATAPFKFIAGMVGGGDNMDSILFTPGSSTLANNEADKLQKLGDALRQRDSLRLELRGAYDPKVDELALKTAKFDAVYQKQLGGRDKEIPVLEAMLRLKAGREAVVQARAMSQKPTGDDKAALALADKAYVQQLRQELIAREVVVESDLRQLALDRARAVRAQLTAKGELDDARVFVLEPQTVSASADHPDQVVLKLVLTAS